MTPAVLFIAMSPPTGTGNFCRHHRAQQFTVRCAEFNFKTVQVSDGGAALQPLRCWRRTAQVKNAERFLQAIGRVLLL